MLLGWKNSGAGVVAGAGACVESKAGAGMSVGAAAGSVAHRRLPGGIISELFHTEYTMKLVVN